MSDSNEIEYIATDHRLPGDPEIGGSGYTLGARIEEVKYTKVTDPYVNIAYQLQDISQSHHFTVTISKIKVEFTTRAFGNFLPVKAISYSEIGYNHMSIPVGIFGNFPIMHKRNVGTINLTLYDTGKDDIEAQIRQWESECFPRGKYVNFLSNIAAEMKYSSFTPTGVLNKTLVLYVIPANSYIVTRNYEENNAKLITISLAVVGFKGDVNVGLQSSGGGVNPPANLSGHSSGSMSTTNSGEELYSGGLINDEPTGNNRFFGGSGVA